MTRTTSKEITIDAGGTQLQGILTLPPVVCPAIVVFAHGSGSGRHSPRNQYVAGVLNRGGFGTLLFDLLTLEEERVDARTGHLRFDIPFLARRLVAVTDWLERNAETADLPVAYFGASTGAGAALMAAAERPERVVAIISRGGRPDLAGPALARVRAPTLLIVGGRDAPVLDLNERAMARMTAPVRLEVVPGATHLFEEPGALERVAALALEWLQQHAGVPR